MKKDDSHKTRQMLYEVNLFREAVKEAARNEGQNLLKQNKELKPEDLGVSSEKQKEFQKRLDKVFQDKRIKEKRISHRRIIQRVAIIVLIFIAVTTASLFSVDAFRAKFFNFLMEIKPKYTEFQLEEGNKEVGGVRIVDWTNTYIPTYIPEGYTLESSDNSDTMKSIILENEDGHIIDYAMYTEDVNFNYDTEGAAVQDIKVNGEEGMLIIKENHYCIVWKQDSLIFIVRTQINEKETLKIAEKVKYIK